MSPSFQGTLFDGETLRATPVTLSLVEGCIGSTDGMMLPPVATTAVRVSDRLGNTARFLYLPGGSTVETTDNVAVDALLASQRRGRLIALIHTLETRARVAATATLLLVASVGTTMWWGLPLLARRVAMAVPADIEQQAGRTSLAAINRILAPSELKTVDRDRVLVQVRRLAKAGGLKTEPEVVFRSMGGQFPNAFALPGGMIVVSDELVTLAGDEELAAVLAHEIGHWQYRHGLQSVLRGSTALLVVSAVSGDLSALTTFAGTIPFLLLQRGYSREFEAQADVYAVDLMRKANIDPRHFISILKKLEGTRPKQGNDFTYLSTHPVTDERIKAVEPRDCPPRLVHQPRPIFPPQMKAAHLSGEVTVEFIVDINGDIHSPRLVRSTYKEFEAPAISAISQWKFFPARKNGENVEILVSQMLEFNADE